MNIIEKVKNLNFPNGEYVVIGSSTMDVLGIRPSNDIDIAVTKNLHKKLRESGEWKEIEMYGHIHLSKDVFEIVCPLEWDEYETTVEEAIAESLVIDGISFMNLDELVKFKQALGRDKDFKDIELIEAYRKNKKQ